MTAGAVLAWVALSLLLAALLLVCSLATVRRLGWERQNYAGKPIATGYGILFPALAVALGGLAAALEGPESPQILILCAAMLGCGAFGLLDDLYGSATPKGLLGHFRLLLREGQVTTGQLKAVGVAGVGLVVGTLAWRDFGVYAIVSGALVALCANCMNLLDTRPGRALTAGLVACLVILVGVPIASPAGMEMWFAIMPLAAGCAVALPVDRGQRAMLGDVGAYSLGAGVGTCLALILPIWAQATLAALLIAFTILADRYSLSALLDRTKRPDEEHLDS